MTNEEIYKRLQLIFDDLFLDPVLLTPTLTAKEVPEWDSLQHISLIVAVEKTFAIRFRTGEVESTKCVGDFVSLIARHLPPAT